MPVLRVNDRQHVLKPGMTRLGEGASADIDVGSAGSASSNGEVLAVVETTDTFAVIRRVGSSVVKVNGVPLGAEPTPLMHGDKVEVSGTELFFAEDAKVGATQTVTREEVASMMQRRGGARATMGTGGRLVSLVDGKEYIVPATGLVIGRDASCTVVVAQNEVSRRHAEIVPSERGYVIHDHSTNGVYVNGARVGQSQLLARSDVVRVGSEEFRFYADVAPAPAMTQPASALSGSVAAPALVPAPAFTPAATPVAAASPAGAADETIRALAVPDEAASSSMASRRVLATLEAESDAPGGARRVEIRLPLVHIGRGAHNDVTLDDDSVSDTHAKLQLREDGWYLVDLGSTNGTFVGSSRIVNERRLDSAADLRFGGVKMAFRPADAGGVTVRGAGTRVLPTSVAERARATREPRTSATLRSAVPAPASAGRSYTWIWVLLLVAAAAAFYLLKS